eukprot:CAMPEP_0183703012 /NCGR_PEP_ID=MMETSP0737-20130205/917_1 /TAXON_ID=385413 /ORGANISM="Thalassiosira miniscula, Strain CCMP1093" /LENGTH=392 /DNA_ID=CAMNT_0025929709 /DNA_START=270 /DNA_END=1445 /DNA_ORIENTATION=-
MGLKSLDIESSAGRSQNPYGPGSPAGQSTANTARTYLTFGLALIAIYFVGKMMLPEEKSKTQEWWASRGDAAGGWGSQHNHPIRDDNGIKSATYNAEHEWDSPVNPHYHENPIHGVSSSADNAEIGALELKETDYLMVLSPLVVIPTHSRQEYEKYQTAADDDDDRSNDKFAEDVLYDKRTPHGMAFDFLVNRDTRKINHDDPHLIQRFVLSLLFYATGGKDDADGTLDGLGGGRTSGWESGSAHFLTGLHECHWVKKSFEDSFWGILSMEGDSDRRVGVTKCNSEMEVTEIRLADLNLVGFIPEEIKWLSSLESLDIQNNHIAGPIPESLGELDELSYLSLDGNNFSGTIPDVFDNLLHLERAYLNFNDFNGAMPPSMCTLREEGVLKDLW